MENSVDPDKPADLDLHYFQERIYWGSEAQRLFNNASDVFCLKAILIPEVGDYNW